MTWPKLTLKQAKVLEFLLANVPLSVRVATSDIEALGDNLTGDVESQHPKLCCKHHQRLKRCTAT